MRDTANRKFITYAPNRNFPTTFNKSIKQVLRNQRVDPGHHWTTELSIWILQESTNSYHHVADIDGKQIPADEHLDEFIEDLLSEFKHLL